MAKKKNIAQQIVELHEETTALCQSELACELSDVWARLGMRDGQKGVRLAAAVGTPGDRNLYDVLNRLEEATRTSQLRKVIR